MSGCGYRRVGGGGGHADVEPIMKAIGRYSI